MREKSAHCPRRDSNLYLWDTRPPCFRLHHEGKAASRQSKQTLQTLTRQLHRETIMHETLQLPLSTLAKNFKFEEQTCSWKTVIGASCPPAPQSYTCHVIWQSHGVVQNKSYLRDVCVCVTMKKVPRVCVCVCVCVRERRKMELTVWGKKVPIALDGIRTCTSGIRAHRASDYTTRVRLPRVSRNKHFSHSSVSSTAKQSCMKHSNSYRSAGPRRQASARTSAESDEACQRKTKDGADGMREKSAHCPRRDSNLHLRDTRPPCFRLHYEGQAASRQSKQTL